MVNKNKNNLLVSIHYLGGRRISTISSDFDFPSRSIGARFFFVFTITVSSQFEFHKNGSKQTKENFKVKTIQQLLKPLSTF